MKTKQELAEEYSNELDSIKDIDCPRSVKNPGLYFGFLAGYEACENALKSQLKGTFYEGPGNHSVYQLESLMAEREEMLYQKQLKIQDLEAEISRLKDRYESKFMGRP